MIGVSDIIAAVKALGLRNKAQVDAAILVAVPTQTAHSGEYLTTNGTLTAWAAVPAAGLARELVIDAANIPTFL